MKNKTEFSIHFHNAFWRVWALHLGPQGGWKFSKMLQKLFSHPYWSISERNDDNEGRFQRILVRFWEAAGSNFLILQPIFHSDFWKVFEALSIALESISGPEKGPSFASRERSKTLSLIPGGCKFWKMLPKESVTSLLKHFGMQWWSWKSFWKDSAPFLGSNGVGFSNFAGKFSILKMTANLVIFSVHLVYFSVEFKWIP